jgi:uncharacterized protein
MRSSLESWIRRLHTYSGLYFLFFIWLFAASGLILNHPGWSFAWFWPQRERSSTVVAVAAPPAGGATSAAHAVMAQLGIRGEVSAELSSDSPSVLRFRSVRPGEIVEVSVDKAKGAATVNRIRVNRWGILNMLHSFTGVRRSDPALHQNWWATGVWRLSMDALSIGLAFMVLSGLCVWFMRSRRRAGGIVALLLGTAIAGFFLAGL